MDTIIKGRIAKSIAVLLVITLLFTPVTALADSTTFSVDITVTLDANGGKLAGKSSFSITGDTDTVYPNLSQYGIPTKEGHKFNGWFKSRTGGTAVKEGDIAGTENHTLYAQWTANKYTVYFKGNGGSASKSSMSVTFGSKYGTLPKATRSSYGFIGWYTKDGKKITSGTFYKTTGNTTLYAKWGKKYKLSFNANGGKVSKKSQTVTKGLSFGTLPTPKRTGYNFKGWYTKKSGGTKITKTKTVGISKNTTLYARWSLKKIKLTFNANKGKVSKSSKSVKYGKRYGTLPKPTRKGYNFKGWYTKKSGGSKVTKYTINKRTSNRTLYARWSAKKIKVTFNANKGKVSTKRKTIKYNKKYGKLPKPKRSGYKFKGWYSKKSGGTKITKSSTMKYTKKKTLYARWAKISKVTFDYNKGKKGKKSKSIVYSEKYGSLPSTKRAGYKLKGWYTKKSGGTRVTSSTKVKAKKNIKLYAQWEFTLSIKSVLAPIGSKCRPGYKMDFEGVTIHNTGNTAVTADANNHAMYLQGTGKSRSASWHYCVDKTNITMSIPENEIAWHAGDGTLGFGNRKTIAIEICMNKGGDLEAATNRAAKLTAYILVKKGHKSAVSGKNLFQHNHHSGKNCPEMIRKGKPYSWSTFVKKVNSYM